MDNFVRTAWGIECFLCKTEFGYKSWILLPSGLSDEEVLAKIEVSEQKLLQAHAVVAPTEITVTYKYEKEIIMNRTDKTLVLVAQLLDKWDDLPNDITSEPELEQVSRVMSQIENLVDDDSEELDVNDLKGIIEKNDMLSEGQVIEEWSDWYDKHYEDIEESNKSDVSQMAFWAGVKAAQHHPRRSI